MKNQNQSSNVSAVAATSEALTQIERILGQCVSSEKKRWIQIYQLMDQVKEGNLYEGRGIKSFTAWVRVFAEENCIHESTLWRRYRAGRVYAEYVARVTARGKEAPDLGNVSIPVESLILCKTIAGKNDTQLDALVQKVIKGELRQQDLRAAAKERKRQGDDRGGEKDRLKEVTKDTFVAKAILQALCRGGWINECQHSRFHERVYRVWAEFPVYNGSSRAARRVDALVVENLSVSSCWDVVLRGIEIKVSRSDLIGDKKMAEYADFVDFFYLAVPATPSMIEAADLARHPAWGVLTVNVSGEISVVREAVRLPGIFRDKALSRVLLRLVRE